MDALEWGKYLTTLALYQFPPFPPPPTNVRVLWILSMIWKINYQEVICVFKKKREKTRIRISISQKKEQKECYCALMLSKTWFPSRNQNKYQIILYFGLNRNVFKYLNILFRLMQMEKACLSNSLAEIMDYVQIPGMISKYWGVANIKFVYVTL